MSMEGDHKSRVEEMARQNGMPQTTYAEIQSEATLYGLGALEYVQIWKAQFQTFDKPQSPQTFVTRTDPKEAITEFLKHAPQKPLRMVVGSGVNVHTVYETARKIDPTVDFTIDRSENVSPHLKVDAGNLFLIADLKNPMNESKRLFSKIIFEHVAYGPFDLYQSESKPKFKSWISTKFVYSFMGHYANLLEKQGEILMNSTRIIDTNSLLYNMLAPINYLEELYKTIQAPSDQQKSDYNALFGQTYLFEQNEVEQKLSPENKGKLAKLKQFYTVFLTSRLFGMKNPPFSRVEMKVKYDQDYSRSYQAKGGQFYYFEIKATK